MEIVGNFCIESQPFLNYNIQNYLKVEKKGTFRVSAQRVRFGTLLYWKKLGKSTKFQKSSKNDPYPPRRPGGLESTNIMLGLGLGARVWSKFQKKNARG